MKTLFAVYVFNGRDSGYVSEGVDLVDLTRAALFERERAEQIREHFTDRRFSVRFESVEVADTAETEVRMGSESRAQLAKAARFLYEFDGHLDMASIEAALDMAYMTGKVDGSKEAGDLLLAPINQLAEQLQRVGGMSARASVIAANGCLAMGNRTRAYNHLLAALIELTPTRGPKEPGCGIPTPAALAWRDRPVLEIATAAFVFDGCPVCGEPADFDRSMYEHDCGPVFPAQGEPVEAATTWEDWWPERPR